MSITTEVIVDAIRDAFGAKPWSPGDTLKRAKTKNAFAHALSTPPTQIKVTDLKNMINQLWEEGIVEIIPPKGLERSYKFRLKDTPTEPVSPILPDDTSNEKALFEAYQELRRESQFRHVYLSDLQERSGISIEKLHAWASAKARNCEFELGQADWSLAKKSQRDASVKINGTNYLTVGLLT